MCWASDRICPIGVDRFAETPTRIGTTEVAGWARRDDSLQGIVPKSGHLIGGYVTLAARWAVLTITMIADLMASGSSGHASATRAKSGDARLKNATQSATLHAGDRVTGAVPCACGDSSAVLKTAVRATAPGVRIPPHPPSFFDLGLHLGVFNHSDFSPSWIDWLCSRITWRHVRVGMLEQAVNLGMKQCEPCGC